MGCHDNCPVWTRAILVTPYGCITTISGEERPCLTMNANMRVFLSYMETWSGRWSSRRLWTMWIALWNWPALFSGWRPWELSLDSSISLSPQYDTDRGLQTPSWGSDTSGVTGNPDGVLEKIQTAVPNPWTVSEENRQSGQPHTHLCTRRRGDNLQEKGGPLHSLSISDRLWGKEFSQWTTRTSEWRWNSPQTT